MYVGVGGVASCSWEVDPSKPNSRPVWLGIVFPREMVMHLFSPLRFMRNQTFNKGELYCCGSLQGVVNLGTLDCLPALIA